MTRLVVTGSKGQVVSALLERAAGSEFQVIALGRPQLDLRDESTIRSALTEARPAAIISAAAYTAVDRAESEAELAMQVNGRAPGVIAAVATELGVPVVHLSTDYVFDGRKSSPYVEDDPTGPDGAYAVSKLEGERAVRANAENHAILRTAWVYSPFGANFVKTMLRLASDRPVIRVVDDQRGNPTSALDIADGVLGVVSNLLQSRDAGLRGTFHLVGSGEATWADFAEGIFDQSARHGGPAARVERITTVEYPTPAPRPANSRLSTEKIGRVHGVSMPRWQDSTKEAVQRLLQPSQAQGH